MSPRPAGRSGQIGQLGDVDLRLLKVFKSVVDCGGMAAAELELNIGVSTISRHVKDLEDRLGLTLCRRGRAGFSLTTEGERIYEETMQLLTAVDRFRGSVDDVHRRMGGQLRIGVFDKTASNPKARIGDALAAFVDHAPEVELQMQVATIHAIERQVIDGSLHVGIIPAHRASPSLLYRSLFDETMLLYCGVGHPWFGADHAALDWSSLHGRALAGLGYHSPNMELSHRAGLRRAATGLDQEAIATLVLSGRFLGFLPDHYAEAFERSGRMQSVRPQMLNYTCTFVCITRRSPAPTRATQAFLSCLLYSHGVAAG